VGETHKKRLSTLPQLFVLKNMYDKIQQDLKQAQLSKEEMKVSTLRMLMSELKYAQIKKSEDLTDEDIIGVVQKELKKRQESIEAFEKAGRSEMAENEKKEVEILKVYLPPQLSDEELSKIVIDAIAQTGASTPSDMGKVIGVVMQKVGQSASGSQVSSIVKSKLAS
jgi:uncharacterized protein YqeY